MKALLLFFFLLICFTGRAQVSNDSVPVKMHKMQELTVSANSLSFAKHVESTQMGKIDLPVSMLVKVPSLGGEPDVIKALQLTPGVKRGSEGSIGMYVRGGGNDENLILLDGAPVYNAGHLLGFFSIFNAQSLKDVQMFKSSFPVQYGGRLSSVLDIHTKEGSFSATKAALSLGAIASSATVQGPVIKDKLSFMVSARRTYIDKVYKYIPYHFYDVNAKLAYKADEHNRFYISVYKGDDVLNITPSTNKIAGARELKTGMKLGNESLSFRWNYSKATWVSDVSVYYSRFNYDINGTVDSNFLSMRSAIRDIGIRYEIKTFGSSPHKWIAGYNVTHHLFNPNIVSSSGPLVERFGNRNGKYIENVEGALYAGDDYRISGSWQLNAGFRFSGTAVAGMIYANAEPRLGLRWLLNERNAVKLSYARMSQYMHLVSSSSLALPTDLWYPVTQRVKPGLSDQASIGYYHTIPATGITFSAELYYKRLKNLVEYKEGALLVMNDDYERELVHGKGRSYGMELFAGKTSGKFTGWLGYSLSFARRQFDSLNKGRGYYARYDRRHDLSLVAMYDINNRWAVSSTVVYATGSPFTGQSSQYVAPKPGFAGFDILPAYTMRNELRMSAAFRIDMDLCYKFRLGKYIHGDAHVNVYNLLNRTQPHNVQRVYDEATASYKYRQTGLFGTITTGSVNLNL